jgi:preprotein translocase subunit SecY
VASSKAIASSPVGNLAASPELLKRILFTITMLAVYRLGVHVSTPGIDVAKLRQMFEGSQQALFGLMNLFSGGALENFSIFTLGITPYISVSIIMQVLTPIVPALEALKKEGDAGRRIITRYTRWGTILLALVQSYAIAQGLRSQGLVSSDGANFTLTCMVTLTAGTAFIMWLGEQITERGIGNGTSMVIFAGIVARMPSELISTLALARTGEVSAFVVLFVVAFALATVFGIVYVERSLRKIPVQYPRRSVGKNITQAMTQYMPLKVNMAGVLPPIFGSAVLAFFLTFAAFSTNEVIQQITAYLRHGSWSYAIIFGSLIFLFSFFYTSIIFNPEETAEQLKKNGGSIPTVRPGKPTAEYLYFILNRLTLWGAIYITLVCLIPELVFLNLGVPGFSSVFGGTAILIVVGVTLDTASQIESHVVARNYENFMNQSSKSSRAGVGSAAHTRARLARK